MSIVVEVIAQGIQEEKEVVIEIEKEVVKMIMDEIVIEIVKEIVKEQDVLVMVLKHLLIKKNQLILK